MYGDTYGVMRPVNAPYVYGDMYAGSRDVSAPWGCGRGRSPGREPLCLASHMLFHRLSRRALIGALTGLTALGRASLARGDRSAKGCVMTPLSNRLAF